MKLDVFDLPLNISKDRVLNIVKLTLREVDLNIFN